MEIDIWIYIAAFFVIFLLAAIAAIYYIVRNRRQPQEQPRLPTTQTPVKIDTRARLIELRARRNALFNLKNRMCDFFKVYEPAPIFLEYAQASWDLCDEQDSALTELEGICRESIEYRNKFIERERVEQKKKAEEKEKATPAIERLKASGGRKR